MNDIKIAPAITRSSFENNDYVQFQIFLHQDESTQRYLWSPDNIAAMIDGGCRSLLLENDIGRQHLCDELMETRSGHKKISVQEYGNAMIEGGGNIGDLTKEQSIGYFKREAEGMLLAKKIARDKGVNFDIKFAGHSKGEKAMALIVLHDIAVDHPEFDCTVKDLRKVLIENPGQVVGEAIHTPYVANDAELLQVLNSSGIGGDLKLSSDAFKQAANPFAIKARVADDDKTAQIAKDCRKNGKVGIVMGAAHGNMYNGNDKEGRKDLDEWLEVGGAKTWKLALSPNQTVFQKDLGEFEEIPLTVFLTAANPLNPDVCQLRADQIPFKFGGEIDTDKVRGINISFKDVYAEDLSYLPQPVNVPPDNGQGKTK